MVDFANMQRLEKRVSVLRTTALIYFSRISTYSFLQANKKKMKNTNERIVFIFPLYLPNTFKKLMQVKFNISEILVTRILKV